MKTAGDLEQMFHAHNEQVMGTAGIRDLGGFLKEVFVGDRVPNIPQGLSCSSTEKERNAVKISFSRKPASLVEGGDQLFFYNNTFI